MGGGGEGRGISYLLELYMTYLAYHMSSEADEELVNGLQNGFPLLQTKNPIIRKSLGHPRVQSCIL